MGREATYTNGPELLSAGVYVLYCEKMVGEFTEVALILTAPALLMTR